MSENNMTHATEVINHCPVNPIIPETIQVEGFHWGLFNVRMNKCCPLLFVDHSIFNGTYTKSNEERNLYYRNGGYTFSPTFLFCFPTLCVYRHYACIFHNGYRWLFEVRSTKDAEETLVRFKGPDSVLSGVVWESGIMVHAREGGAVVVTTSLALAWHGALKCVYLCNY